MDTQEKRTKSDFEKEYKEIIKWDRAETKRILDELKAKGVPLGLDGGKEYYWHIRQKAIARVKDLQARYQKWLEESENKEKNT